MFFKRLLLSGLLLLSLKCLALPFSVVPLSGHSLPTIVTQNSPVFAYYTVTNKTSRSLSGIYVAYLPINVSQVTTGTVPNLCGQTFSLAPKASCTLQLSVSGVVSSNDPDPHQHLFICLPGAKTCAGTLFSLNVAASGWIDTGLNAGSGSNINALATSGSTVYVGGDDNQNYPAFWTYLNGSWQLTNPASLTTGSSASIATINPTTNIQGPLLYLGTTGMTTSWVFQYQNQTSTNTDLPSDGANYLSSLQVSALDTLTNTLYVAGYGSITNGTPQPGGYLFYNANHWTLATNPAQGILIFSSFSDMLFSAQTNALYVSGYGTDHTQIGPIVAKYSIGDETWSTLSIAPIFTTQAISINSIALDVSGNLFAGGINRNNLGLVLQHNPDDSWSALPAIPLARNILSLQFNAQGILFAAGLGTDGSGYVWQYNQQQNQWITLPMARNKGIYTIAFDANQNLYALGLNSVNAPMVLMYPS